MNASFAIVIFFTSFLLHLATSQHRNTSTNATLTDHSSLEVSPTNDGRRKELRELSDKEIADMVEYFESIPKAKPNLNVSLLEEIDQESPVDEQFISRLEDALNLTLPYWDFELDRRLPNPLDSVIFHSDILRSNESLSSDCYFNAESSFRVHSNECDHDISDGMHALPRLEAIQILKQNHFTYFLYVLLQVATFSSYDYSVDGCERCSPSNKWLFCDSTQMHCVSKVVINGNCSSFEGVFNVCHESVCINGTCSNTSASTPVPTNNSSDIITTDDNSSAMTNAQNETIAYENDNSTDVLSELISGKTEEFEFVSFAPIANIYDQIDTVPSLPTHSALHESNANMQQLHATRSANHSSADTATPEDNLNSTSLSTSPPLVLPTKTSQQSNNIQTNASQPPVESLNRNEFQEKVMNTSVQTTLPQIKTTQLPSDQQLSLQNTPLDNVTAAFGESLTSDQLPIVDITSSVPSSSPIPTTITASSANSDAIRSSATVLISSAVTVSSSVVHSSSSATTPIPSPPTTVQIPTALSSPTTTLSLETMPSSSTTLASLIPDLEVVQLKGNETVTATITSAITLSQPFTETFESTNSNITHTSTPQPTTTANVVVVDDNEQIFANNQSLFTFEKNITCDDDDNQYVPAAHDLLPETLPCSTHRSSYSATTTTSPASTPTLTRFQPQVEFDNSSGTTESLLSDDATKSSITPQTSSLPLSLSWADDPAKALSLHHANVSIDAPSTSTSVTLMITKTTPRPQQYVKKGLRPSGKRRNKKPGRRKNKTRHKFKDVQGDVHKANGEHTLASTTQIYQQFNDDNSSSSRPSTSSPPYSQYTSSQSQINHISSESHLHTSLATPTYSHSTLPSSIHDQQQQTTTSSALLVHFSITIIKGEPRRRTLLNRRVEQCDITITGMNMPNGYTQSSKGRLVAGTTIGLVHTLDPELHAPLVELRITVEDRLGRECVQKCLNSKGFYDRCDRDSVRLTSHEFIAFADPIEIHQSEEDVLKNQWSGRGYYKKRKKDYLLFSCAKS